MRGSASFLTILISSLALSSSVVAAQNPSPFPSDSAGAPESLELQLRYDAQAEPRLTLVDQRVRPGLPPKQRNPSLQANEWLLTGETADGELLWRRRIPNPVLVFYDQPDPAAPAGSGLLTGGSRLLPAADFRAVVPARPGLARVTAYAPVDAGGEEIATRVIGSCSVQPEPAASPSPSPWPSPWASP
jgi:hypothetical protein